MRSAPTGATQRRASSIHTGRRAEAYDAFISYSHAADGQLAPAVQRGLQRFAKPWYRLRALRVFRDEANLGADPGLWSSIERALDRSQHFILLASPQAASSRWVAREAAYWRDRKSADTLLIALTDGLLAWDEAGRDFDWSHTDAVPETLRGAFREEPRVVDLRFATALDTLSLSHPRFRDAIADLAAPLHQIPKDELAGEEVRQHRRTVLLVRFVGSILVALLAAAVVLATLAVIQRNRARAGESNALAEQAFGVAGADPIAALRLAITAAHASPTPQAEAALRVALAGSFPRTLERTSVRTVVVSPHGSAFLTLDRSKIVRLWDSRSGQRLLVLGGHTGTFTSAVFSADGRRVLTGSRDGKVRVWDAENGRRLAVFLGHTAAVESAAFNGNGTKIVTGSDDGTARIWDAATGEPLRVLRGHTEPVRSAVFSPDDTLILTASEDRTARLWDTTNGRTLNVVHAAPAGNTLHAPVTASFSPTGTEFLTSGSVDGAARLWHSRSGKRLAVLRDAAQDAVFSRDGAEVLTAGNVNAQLWDAKTGKRLLVLRTGDGIVRTARFSRDGRMIVTAGDSGVARVWDATSGAVLQVLHTRGPLSSATFSQDTKHVFTGGLDGLEMWQAARLSEPSVLRGHSDDVVSAVFSPDGGKILTTSYDGTARIWDTRSRTTLHVLRGRKRIGDLGVFSPDGKRVLTIGSSAVGLWETASGKLLRQFPDGNSSSPVAAFSPDGSRILTPLGDTAVQVRDADTATRLRVFRTRRHLLATAVFNSDGKKILASGEGGARIWDARTGKTLRVFESGYGTAAFSPQGKTVLTSGDDGTRIWDVATGKLLDTLMPEMTGAVFDVNGHHILAYNDRTARIFDMNGTSLHVLRGHSAEIAIGAFSRDGKEALTAGYDGTVRIWDTASGQPLRVIRDHIVNERRIENGLAGFNSAVFSPDGHHILTATDRTPHLWFCKLCGLTLDQLLARARNALKRAT